MTFFSRYFKKAFLACIAILILLWENQCFSNTTIQVPDYYFEIIPSPNAFSNQIINAILKDKYGYIWIGTNYGLYRYNGSTVAVYRHHTTDTNSIAFNNISTIYEDKVGSICIFGNNTTIYCKYNFDYDNFSQFNIDSSLNIYPFPVPYSKVGKKYLCSNEKIFKFNALTDDYEQVALNTALDKLEITSYVEDNQGNLWIGSFTVGLLKYDSIQNSLQQFKVANVPDDYMCNSRINELYYDSEGLIWVGGLRNGINIFNPKTEQFVKTWNTTNKPQGINLTIKSFCEDEAGRIWMATENGINIYNKNNNDFCVLNSNLLINNNIASNNIETLYKDNTNTIWCGSYEGNVNIYNPYRIKFSDKLPEINNSSNKLKRSFKSAYRDSKGNLWVGTDWGLNKFEPSGKLSATFESVDNTKSIGKGGVCAICESNTGQLWFGTWGGGLSKFNAKNNTFTRFDSIDILNDNNHLIGDVNVLCIREDNKGQLWLGTLLGIVDVFNPITSTFRHIKLNGENIRNILLDEKRNLAWCSSSNGIFAIDMSNYNIKHYSTDEATQNTISDNFTTDIAQDKSGNIWITSFNGLTRFDSETNNFSNFHSINNIQLENLFGLQIDGKGNLWFAGSSNLYNYNPNTNKLIFFSEPDGILENLRFSNLLSTGEIIFGGSEGVNIFMPDSVRVINAPSKIIITDFKVFNKPVHWHNNTFLTKTIEQTRYIKLTHKETSWGFEFTALNYNMHDKYQYACMLEGFEKEWNYLGSSQFVNYSNISPGKYIFKVKAFSKYGYATQNEASIQIEITPPIWKTWWFRVLYLVSVFSSIYVFIKLKTSNIKKLNERLEQEVKVRTQYLQVANSKLEEQKTEMARMADIVHETDQKRIRFLVNISHEFRSPLTLIINPIENILSKISGNHEFAKISDNLVIVKMLGVISKNAQSLLNIINQVLDMRKLETANMELEIANTDLSPLLLDIYESFNQLAIGGSLDFIFESNFKSLNAWFDAPKIERILINLLSNAFKFTPKNGKILFKAELMAGNEWIKIDITDSGIGIPNDKLKLIFERYYQIKNEKLSTAYGSGIGLNLAKELIELHHGTIHVISEPNKGSCFTVTFPIQKHYYANHELLAVSKEMPEYSAFISDTELESLPPSNEKLAANAPQVLIVDDNNDLRLFIKQYLSGYYRVIEASNGLTGLQKAIEKMPDIIISDIIMPLMDGFELCEKIKTDASVCHIPVILLTSQLDIDNQLHGLAVTADDYITKPFNINILKAKIDSIIKNRDLMRTKFSLDFKIGLHEMAITSLDQKFMEKALIVVEQFLDDSMFDVETFSHEMGVSRRQLLYKLKALTGFSPGDFIRNFRLKRAAQLILESGLNISEIAYATGFSNALYFSTAFKKQFGVPPSEYKDKLH